MNKEQALDLLIQVAHLAQSRGALKMKESVMIFQAIEVLRDKTEELGGDDVKTAVDTIKNAAKKEK